MCGFLGVYAPRSKMLAPDETPQMRSCFELLAHRGNSGSGEETSTSYALFHYRLAFRDVALGKQPLSDRQKRATILFNGELYDFHPLRDRLAKNYDFQTRSDTEVILAAYLEYGEKFLDYLDGEFAFTIYDHRNGKVIAARDAFGVKPLFWTAEDSSPSSLLRKYQPTYEFNLQGRLHFASEMKGLPIALRWDTRGLDRLFLGLFEEMGTSFQGVFALPPGSLFVASPLETGWKINLTRRIAKHRELDPRHNSFEESARELREIISRNVEMKLDSEVPLGAYLSGGIDSRIAAFEMSKAGAEIETFTVGFEGADYDETKDVQAFLRSYPNLKGRALRTTNDSLAYSYPHAIFTSELVQPYTNGSAKWWLSRFARRHVRGVLTGDGADELFCGYPSYRYLAWWSFYKRHPSQARAPLYQMRVEGFNGKQWEKGLSSRSNGSDLEESMRVMGWAHPLYAQLKAGSFFRSGSSELLEREVPDVLSYANATHAKSPLAKWQNYFLQTHFSTHVLNWVGDRMEMANTLEGRPIYLSKAALEFVRGVPDHYLVRGMRSKAILRKAYADSLGSFASAPKKQFNAPFLLDGALGREFLSENALKQAGLVDPLRVQAARRVLAESTDGLERSFAQIFLQNCLVTQMLDRYLVRRDPPVRDMQFEEKFLDRNTVTL